MDNDMIPWLSSLADVNWLAIAIAFVVTMAVGFVWYLPAVLGGPWMKAIGKTPEEIQESDPGAGVWAPMMIAAAATTILLAVLVTALGLSTFLAGAWFAFVVAVVFRAGGHVIHNGFAGRPVTVTVIDSGHDVLAMTLAGGILGAFL